MEPIRLFPAYEAAALEVGTALTRTMERIEEIERDRRRRIRRRIRRRREQENKNIIKISSFNFNFKK